GAVRLLDSSSSLFDEKDGLARIVVWMFEGFENRTCAVSTAWTISCFDGRRFHQAAPAFASRLGPAVWRGHFGVLRDHEDGWWFASNEGLYRFGKITRLEELPRATPIARYTKKDGLSTDTVACLLEDREGDVWIGTFAPVSRPLMRWKRATSRFESFGAEAGLPEFGSAVVLTKDAAGDVWIAYRDGTLARHREGRFQVVSGRNGFSSAPITSLSSDRAGRLWATTTGGGLVFVEKPDAPEPRAVVFGPREGVSGYFLKGLSFDDAGRPVFGTDRDLVRFDPARRVVEKVLADRVFVHSEVDSGFRDAGGALWFATWRGAVRVLPAEDRPRSPARARVAAVRVDGAGVPVPARGAEHLDLGKLQSSARVSFELFGLGAIGQPLSFEHLMEGLDEHWSAPEEERVLHFARFSPGRYRLRVRAAGAASAAPEAVVAFTVLGPLWSRPWFLLALASALVAAGWAGKATRTRRRQELDAVRTRIAADLHDDLGAGLSRISILADVAKTARADGSGTDETLAKIADASREVDERLADGLWAVDPACDDLAGLAKRLRLLAEELFEPLGISWRVTIPDGAGDVPLRPDRRREIYLLAKEAVVNAARHAGARHVTIDVAHDRRRVVVTVEDDGRGFDAGATPADRLSGGRGVSNMRRRATALGGTAELTSAPGRGTRVRFEVPKGRA
ncbi:MAG TPA: ATP-binding protein, partial [Thermoanaerobaculia bacterium]|nr:ATP-binding protein [Thermoanaerobaculia bacterium]